MPDEPSDRMESTDPESEQCFAALTEVVRAELAARVDVGDDPKTPEGLDALSELIADAVLDAFSVRARSGPRWKPWSKPPYPV